MLRGRTKVFLIVLLESEMFYQGRFVIVWLSWLVGGLCGVAILLVIICYCRLMPRHQKSVDEQYLKENYATKENYAYTSQQDNYRLKHAERGARPASFACDVSAHGAAGAGAGAARSARASRNDGARDTAPHAADNGAQQYASSTMLDESSACSDALKTRSLPASVRGRARPLSASDARPLLHPLLAKVNLSKKCKNRMRSEHAAIIALSKSRSQLLDADLDADAVIVYDQRTRL